MTSAQPSPFDPQGHLLDVVLDDVAHGDVVEETEEHLADCLFCRIRLRRLKATTSPRVDIDAVVGALPAPPVVPPGVRAALLASDSYVAPKPEDVWLTAGRNISMVWIRKIIDDAALVQPVVFDTEMADDHTLVLPADANPLGVPLAVFCSVDAQVDLANLDRKLFPLAVGDAVDALRTSRRTGATPRSDVAVGSPIDDPDDERHEFRQGLADRLTSLSAPDDAGQDSATAEVEDRLGGLRLRRPQCRFVPCGQPVAAAASAAGWKAVTTVREIDAVIVVVLGSFEEGAATAALELLDVASATAVAFVDDSDDYDTRIYDATALAVERIIAPSGARWGVNTHVAALEIVDALSKHLEEMVLPDDTPDTADRDEDIPENLDDIAQTEAFAAVAAARSRRFQRFKGEAFKGLTDDDARFVTETIVGAAIDGQAVEALRIYAHPR